MRRICAIAWVGCLLVASPALPARITHADDSAAEQAAREIADAQDAAQAAAEALNSADERLEELNDQQADLLVEIAGLQGQVSSLQLQLEDVVIRRFTQSSMEGSPILSGFSSPTEQMQVSALSRVIWDSSDQALDEFDSANRDLAATQRTLERRRQQTEQQKKDLAALKTRAEQRVQHLKEVEQQRLKDAATRAALDRERKRRAAKSQATAASAAMAAGAGGTRAVGVLVSVGAGADMGPGVRLGSGIGYPLAPLGAGSRATTSGVDWSGTDWVCPTGHAKAGFGHSFIPQTTEGVKYHNGIDMMAREGTLLLAVVSGVAEARVNNLGGMTIYLRGDDGAFYYYAHLEAWGHTGRVNKGDVVGYVGMTGRAGGFHLHFQYHPGGYGTDPVDPYNILKSHC